MQCKDSAAGRAVIGGRRSIPTYTTAAACPTLAPIPTFSAALDDRIAPPRM